MILHDHFALHRKWWDWEWKPEMGDDAWTPWDYILAEVYQIIDDYTDKQSGQIMWFDQSAEVRWDVKSIFSGSIQEIEATRKQRKELKPGESLYAVPVFDNPNSKPTLATWIQDMEENKADLRPAHVRDARPPTAQERAARKAMREKNSGSDKLE